MTRPNCTSVKRLSGQAFHTAVIIMTDPIYIEFRLRGYAKRYANWVKACINKEAKKLRLKNNLKQGHVSHITLFGPARTNHIRHVIGEVENVCKRYTLIPFNFGGFDGFLNRDANYLYFQIEPSITLIQLRKNIAQNLIQSHPMVASSCTPFDKSLKFKFHSTIGKFPSREKEKFLRLLEIVKSNCTFEEYKKHKANVFEMLLLYISKILNGERESRITLHLLRITMLGRRSHIRCEYDLMLKRMLSRRDALSRYWDKRTYEKFKSIKSISG
jgi:hypothetical protein